MSDGQQALHCDRQSSLYARYILLLFAFRRSTVSVIEGRV
jgi:hypothetical protein